MLQYRIQILVLALKLPYQNKLQEENWWEACDKSLLTSLETKKFTHVDC